MKIGKVFTGILTLGLLAVAGGSMSSNSHAASRYVQPTYSQVMNNGTYNNPANKTITYTQDQQNDAANFKNTKMYQLAASKLGDPYVWGGNGPYVFDCSGFTKYIYKHTQHRNLPRLAGTQYYKYHNVAYVNAKPGDLVFFGANPEAISHVGLYIGDGYMIDAQLRGVIIEKVIAPWWNLVGVARVTNHIR